MSIRKIIKGGRKAQTWYLYYMVAHNMLLTCKGEVFFLTNFKMSWKDQIT